MAKFTWIDALDTVGRGDHSLVGVERVREACRALRVEQLPLHPTEIAEVERLRATAARLVQQANEIENRPVRA